MLRLLARACTFKLSSCGASCSWCSLVEWRPELLYLQHQATVDVDISMVVEVAPIAALPAASTQMLVLFDWPGSVKSAMLLQVETQQLRSCCSKCFWGEELPVVAVPATWKQIAVVIDCQGRVYGLDAKLLALQLGSQLLCQQVSWSSTAAHNLDSS